MVHGANPLKLFPPGHTHFQLTGGIMITDTERIDWLEKSKDQIGLVISPWKDEKERWRIWWPRIELPDPNSPGHKMEPSVHGNSLRDVIDKAIESGFGT